MNDDELLQVTATATGFRLTGEIDSSSAPALTARLDPMPSAQRTELDMEDVEFIDSSGLRVIIDAHLRAEADGKHLVIVKPSKSVQRLLDIAGMTTVLHVEGVD